MLCFFDLFEAVVESYALCISPIPCLNPCPETLEDLLHTLHQGVACCTIAAFLTDHLENCDAGLTLQQLESGLQSAYFHYRSWCRANKLSGASLPFTLSRFGKEKWSALPELSTQYKASAVKTMMFWLADYLQTHAAPSPGFQMRMLASYMLAKFQHILDTSGPWLGFQETQDAVANGRGFLLLYQRLALEARSKTSGHHNYKITPKFHSFLHMLLTMQRTGRNPRYLVIYKLFALSL